MDTTLTAAPGRGSLRVFLLLAMVGCGGPSSRDYREDRQALTRVLAADAHTAELIDPLLDRLGSDQDPAPAIATLEGEVRGAAGRAARLAEETKTRSPEGRTLRAELLEALQDREAEVRTLVAALRSGRPEDVLEAIRTARELEVQLGELDVRVDALSQQQR